jgi:hypothetical protein
MVKTSPSYCGSYVFDSRSEITCFFVVFIKAYAVILPKICPTACFHFTNILPFNTASLKYQTSNESRCMERRCGVVRNDASHLAGGWLLSVPVGKF